MNTVKDHSDRYSEYLDIADKADKAAVYLEQGKLPIENAPIEPILMLYEKLCSSGLAPMNELENLLCLYEKLLPSGDKKAIAALIRMTSEHIREAVKNHEKIIQARSMVSEINHLKNNDRIRDHYKGTYPERRQIFKGRGVVYSCITGGYDDIREPEFITEALDHVFFTDDPKLASDVWDVKTIPNPDHLSPGMLARRVKIFPWEYLGDYDYSIWIDGKIQPIADISEYINAYSVSEPILCFNHYECRGIVEEAGHIIDMGKADPQLINSQLSSYLNEGYPGDINSVDTCVLVRDHHDEHLKKVMSDWWDELNKWSIRDQMSFGYVCWKNDLVYDTSPLYVYDNPFFTVYSHK